MSIDEKIVIRSRAEEISHESILAVLDEILARDADHQAVDPEATGSQSDRLDAMIRNAIYGLPSL